MTPEQRRSRLDDLAARIWAVRQELEQLLPELGTTVDRKAIGSILTNLTWATENCTVVGLHQVGQALDDNMGVTDAEPDV